MADEQTTVDTAGVTRAADGTISDGQTTQADQSTTTTNQDTATSKPEGKTLLTEGAKTETAKDAKTEDKKDVKAEGAPEKYADYKVPEGFAIDPKVKDQADALFKGLGLTQEQAQSLIDLSTAVTAEQAKAPYEAYQKVTDGWRKDAEAHPDLRGKLGPGQEVNVRIARALDGLGDPKLASEFRAAMDLTGVGNHPAFIRVMDKLAQRVTEGTHVAGKGPSELGQSQTGTTSKPTAAAAMWPNLANR
jgi:hypothetical protein